MRYPKGMIEFLAVALVLAGPARADQPLEAAFVQARISGPDAAALEAQIRGGDRTAAMDAVRKAGGQMGVFGLDGQKRLVTALRDAVEMDSFPPEVRAEALRQLGESAPWLRDEITRRTALSELMTVLESPATPSDIRGNFHLQAVQGLAASVGVLTPEDHDFERRAASALLSTYASASDGGERTIILRALTKLIDARPRVAQRQEDPGRRFESLILDPIRADVAGYTAGFRADRGERLAAYRALAALAWATDDEMGRVNIKTVFDAAARTENDPVLQPLVQAMSRGWSRLTHVSPS